MLRQYQYDDLCRIRAAFERHRAVCYQLPTGGGKTIISATLAVEQAQAGKQALYLVHREELVQQTVKTLTEYGLGNHVGQITANRTPTPWAPLQVAMVQTIVNRLDKMPWLDPSLVIIDECHHVRAKSWEMVAKHYPQAKILGLTATPARLDNKALDLIFETLVCGPSAQELMDLGSLCHTRTFSIPVGLDLKGVKKTAGDFNRKDADARVTGPVIVSSVRNVLKYARYRRFIHYAHSIRHSKAFAEEMRGHGVLCEHVDGSMGSAERKGIIKRFRDGSTQALTNVELINEGLDVPECDAVILARRTDSVVFIRQCMGRMMRPKSDGREGLLLDLAGNMEPHGPHVPPEADLEWTLEGGVVQRKDAGERKNYRICDNCGYMNPVRTQVCDMCGHQKETPLPTEINVDLVELQSPAEERKESRAIGRKVNELVRDSGGDPARLKKIQEEYGYPADVIGQWGKLWDPVWRYANK